MAAELLIDDARVQDGLETIALAVGMPGVPPGATGLVFGNEEDLVGGWLFERYTGPGGSIVGHWASNQRKTWITRDMLTLVALYVFDQLQCQQVIGEVRASDTYVIKVNEKLGFKRTTVIPGYFPGDDLIIMTVQREDFRWLPGDTSDGREKQSTPRARL